MFVPRFIVIFLASVSLQACTGLFFQPLKEQLFDPRTIGFSYEDIDFEAADGTKLHGWFFKARGERLGSILFLHGNAENISTHFAGVVWLTREGFDVFAFDYRGYGRSTGTPDLAGLHLDADAALATLIDRPDTRDDRIIVLGQSLGGAIALTTIAESPRKSQLRALVVEGAFAGYRQIAREKLADFWLTWPFQWPISLAIDNSYSPLKAAAALTPLPLLVIHGEADEVIPFHHGQRLFEAASAPKTFWPLPNVGHIQAFSAIGPRQRLVTFLKSAVEAPPPSPAH